MNEFVTLEDHSCARAVSRWRKRLLLLSLVAVPLALLGTMGCVLLFWQDIRLQRAIAETDQLDPGWRSQELEAKRTVLPDAQNSALVLMTARKLLPPQWPIWDKPYAPENKGRDPEATTVLGQSFWMVQPAVQLDDRQTAALREELSRAAAALAEARTVADLPQGRFPLSPAQGPPPGNYLRGYSPNAGETSLVRNLLAYDVLLRAQDRDLDGALVSCRAMLNTARALGDEPLPESISQRILWHFITMQRLERTLAQGVPTEAALAAMQRLLEAEAAEPLLLLYARAERGRQDGALEALQNGETSINQLWTLLAIGRAAPADGWEDFLLRTEPVKMARAALLRFNSQIVEIAKRSAEEQRSALRQLAETQNELPRLVRGAPLDTLELAKSFHLDLALMRSAIVMVAVERYRRARGHWPQALVALVPDFLEKVPLDPYDGAAVRLAQFPQGVTLYSVGEDGQDNGGDLSKGMLRGPDIGWRLWDVPHRRQPKTTQ
ncbi:MAG TPA: hypothetical protein VKU02_07330 [Gemmataceae bacterium]|nr:hypothetical protein [Gemmataceae bacterium]